MKRGPDGRGVSLSYNGFPRLDNQVIKNERRKERIRIGQNQNGPDRARHFRILNARL